MKNSALATVALALAVGVAWIAWPDPAPRDPMHSAPDADTGVLELARSEPLEGALPSAIAEANASPSAQRVEALSPEGVVAGSLFERSLSGVHGRLLTHAGVPVADTGVTLLELHPGMFLRAYRALASGEPPAMEIEAQSARTDSEGRFRLHGARTSGTHALGIDLGGPRGNIVFLEHVLNSGESAAIGDVTLAPSGRVSGRVVDEQGRAVAGARVRAADWPEWVEGMNLHAWRRDSLICAGDSKHFQVVELPAWVHTWEARLPLPTDVSDAEGRFTLEAVQAGEVVPLVDRAGSRPSLQAGVRVDVGGEHELGDLVLRAGRRVAGRVVDGTGKGRAGVEVRVGAVPPDRKESSQVFVVLSPPVVTGADGRFAHEGLPPELPVLLAMRTAPGLAWSLEGPRELEAGELELALPEDAELTLTVRSPTGEPVPQPELAIAAEGPLMDTDVPAGLWPLRPVRDVERPEAGTSILRRLSPGGYRLRVGAEGCASAMVGVDLAPGANQVEVKLEPARALRVRVLADESGEALERCAVSVHRGGEREAALEGGETDARGEVVLARVPEGVAGALVLRVEHPGFALASRELAAASKDLEVRLTRGGSLLARAQREGQPPERLVLFEIDAQMDEESDVTVLGSCDAEGRVRVERLMAGEYRYRVYERFHAQGAFELVESVKEQPEALVQGYFEIENGETTVLEVDLSRPSGLPERLEGSVSGRVALDGVPLAGVEIRLSSPAKLRGRDLRQTTSERGEFEYAGLAPGLYTLVLTGEGGPESLLGDSFRHIEQLAVELGERCLSDFDWTSRRLEVLASSAEDGRALAGVTVTLFLQSTGAGMTSIGGETDAEGVARLLVLGENEYEYVLSASHEEYGLGSSSGALGAHDERLTVDVSAGVPCAGTVRIPTELASEHEGSATLYVFGSSSDVECEVLVELSGGSGAFRIVGLPPDEYSAELELLGRRLTRGGFTLPEGGSESIELEIH